MKALDFVEKLAATARKESPPAVDVAGSVMRRLETEREPVPRFWPLAVAVSVATAAAFLVALQGWVAAREPLVQFLDSIRMVMR